MLSDKLKSNKIILASGSPRRQELFAELNIPYTVDVRNVDEVYDANLKAEEITNYLTSLKAAAFNNSLQKNEIVITADTIVWHNNKALEKPKNKKEAIEMISKFSNTWHTVITSVGLKSLEKEIVFHDTTKVYFKKLSISEITYYVENYQPYDKAGGYGIQEWIGFIGVTKLEGSYYNVMGLPVHKLYEELLKF